ncbi:hypothetical protein FRC17_009923 [Serendipita sp. 399]|nr:hypothetical protein FRC17_009923 [Serendipita sp. 399]
MSLRKIANSLSRPKERNRGNSASSTASWSPSNSRSHTPLSSSISLPDTVNGSEQQRHNSTSLPPQSHQSIGYAYNPNPTPLRIVAPFVYNAPPKAFESSSSLGSNETTDSETKTLRLKRSLNKILSPKEQDFSHDYHYQKQADSRKNKDSKRSRKGSLSGGSTSDGVSFFDENKSSTGSLGSSGGTTKRFVSWMSQRQNGVAKKVNDVLRRDAGSTNGAANSPGRSQPIVSRISSEYREEDDDRSSVSSAQSFVQMAPEDEVSRILAEPDIIPSLNMNQTPFQIPPAVVHVPRSHTNLHALTLTSLAFPPSPHPLLYNPSLPAFPRSSNASSKLPRLPTFRAHLAKTRILDRLEAQNLTQSENESILPFGKRDDIMQKENGPGNPPSETGENEEGRKINDSPGQSVGLEAWTRRGAFLQRVRVWQYDGTRPQTNDGETIRYEAVSSPYRSALKISNGIKALAGLVKARPESRELPELPLSAVGASTPMIKPPSVLESLSPQSLSSSLVIDESMLMDYPDISPSFAPDSIVITVPPAVASVSVASPRPLPTVPPVRPTEPLISSDLAPPADLILTDDPSPVIPVRPLPPVPRPLPIPPVAPAITTHVIVDELESIEGPVVATTVYQTDDISQSYHLSPPSSTHGHTAHAHVGIPSTSTITSAPHTPLDPLETESTRRLSIGSISVVMSGPSGFSLEEMDGLEVTSPHDFDNKRRSVASLKLNVHKRLSMASRASRASSPSLRNHPLPPVSESSRYSESSHLSSTSRHTPTGSAATSVEKLHRQFSPSMSSLPPLEVLEDELSPNQVVIIEPLQPLIENIKGDDSQPHYEPSRKSEENVDPFLVPRLSAVGVPPGGEEIKFPGLANGIRSSIQTLDRTQRASLSQGDDPRLSLRTDIPTPTGPRFDKRSPLVSSSDRPSPTGSTQSPTGSDSLETDASKGSGVRFVKLKRSGSQMSSETSINGGGRSLQRTLKDPSKFWPHNRSVDETAEEDGAETSLDNDASKARWHTERDSMLEQPTPIGADSQPTSAFPGADGVPNLRMSDAFISPDDVPESAVTVKAVLPLANDDQALSSLPLSVALDVARLSDTSNLDLTLINFHSSPSSKNGDLPRNSVSSSTRSEGESLSRSTSVREIAANMPLLPTPSSARLAAMRHGRTPSSERAARIEAHLDSVSSTRLRSQTPLHPRPDFLPYPGSRNRSQQSVDRSEMARASMSSRMSQDGSLLDQDGLSESTPGTPPPNSSFGSRAPPSRWGTSDWKDRQRQLHTLPLPSASIAPSAVRPVPIGRALNRTGSIISSNSTATSRQTNSQLGAFQGRPLRM